MPALGQKVELSKAIKGVPPVIFQVQPDSHIELTTPEELKQWETDLKNFYGVEVESGKFHGACETCSGGCSDDCGVVKQKQK